MPFWHGSYLLFDGLPEQAIIEGLERAAVQHQKQGVACCVWRVTKEAGKDSPPLRVSIGVKKR